MSAAVTSATCSRTFFHGNLAGIRYSVHVRSDLKVKYNSQRYHEPLIPAFVTFVPSLLGILCEHKTLLIHRPATLIFRTHMYLYLRYRVHDNYTARTMTKCYANAIPHINIMIYIYIYIYIYICVCVYMINNNIH